MLNYYPTLCSLIYTINDEQGKSNLIIKTKYLNNLSLAFF